MTEKQKIWLESRERLMTAITNLGYSKEMAALIARELQSIRAMDRMTAYVLGVRPATEELLVDEMLAICSDAQAWREKKKSQEAQQRYNAWLYFGRPDEEEE